MYTPFSLVLQSAEGCTDSGKAGPQVRSVTPAKERTMNGPKDKAWDSTSVRLDKSDKSMMSQAITPPPSNSASPQPDSPHQMPIQPGGVMIPLGSQDNEGPM